MIPLPSKPRTLPAIVPGILAAALFIPLFAIRRIGPFDFWWWMSLNAVAVMAYSFITDRFYLKLIKDDLKTGMVKKILLGVASAVLLYGFFYAGNEVSRVIFLFAEGGINQVYTFKEGASVLRMALLMIFLIGPGEEIFWRGFLQRRWQTRFGSLKGYWLTALLYALMHLASGNIMLVLAAGVCGLFWGALFNRYRSVVMLVVSHTVWDLMIFLIWVIH
ncbi:MAG: CPBP family intramembrane metalloprotease [Candidatus Aminicenantes bacterium]|nr:CPBP family intramembrane metalloprotease [Candidatus Aminicenantes bacterium]